MKQYTSPRTDVVSVQISTAILAGSGRTTPIIGEDEQINAW